MVDLDNIYKINDVIINKDKYTKEPLWVNGSSEYLKNLYDTLIENFRKFILT